MPTVRAKAGVSFEQSRKALLVGLMARARGRATEKVIRFSNDDIPNFLHRLDKFEAMSRQTCVMVK